jgi:hypothetical protein
MDLGASWEDLGRVLGGFWEGFGRVWGGFWEGLEGSWALLGAVRLFFAVFAGGGCLLLFFLVFVADF